MSYLQTNFFSGRWFRPIFHLESFLRSKYKRATSFTEVSYLEALSCVGDDFVQVFLSRVSWDLKYKRATSFTEVSYLETNFSSGRWFRPNFHVESFLRSIVQESHIIHRSELSGDHFHECLMISSKFSCREILEISNTREPHHSQKWANWRPLSWVGDDFVQIFMSRVSWDL